MSKLVLGRQPDDLTILLVKGDPWSAVITLKQDGANEAWPAAPVIEFADGTTWTATLSNASATATWNQTEADVTAALAQQSSKVRLSVNGLTWWAGTVSARG